MLASPFSTKGHTKNQPVTKALSVYGDKVKELTKAKIDAMSVHELKSDIDNEKNSIFKGKEKRDYISLRYSELKEVGALKKHDEKLAAAESIAEASKQLSPIIHTWWFLVGGVCLASLLYIFRNHLGISL